MMLMKITGYFFIVLLMYSIYYEINSGNIMKSPPLLLAIEYSFAGTLEASKKEINDEIQIAEKYVNNEYKVGNIFSFIAKVAGWISFLIAAVITLLAAYYGKPITNLGEPEKLLKELKESSNKKYKLVGVLSAIIAIMTGLNDRATIEAKNYYLNAENIQLEIADARNEAMDSKNKNDMLNALYSLKQINLKYTSLK